METGEIKAQMEYWLDLFKEEIPRLNLPVDDKRPPVFTFEGDSYRFILAGEEAKKFKGLGSRYGGTLYMNMLAALNVLFYKYTGQSDIIIGSGIAGRRHADLQGIVGMFINTLAMRNYPVGEKTYESFLKEVITGCVSGFENQDVQFEDLVDNLDLERDASRNPVFDIMMMVQNFRRVGEVEGVSRAEVESPAAGEYKNSTAKFDMTFLVNEQGDDIFINIQYYTAIFKPATIQRIASYLKNVIKAVGQNPGLTLMNIEIISDEEKQQVLVEFNDTARNFPRDKTIHQLFAEQVEKTPDHIALVGADPRVCPTLFVGLVRPVRPVGPVQLTYRQLNGQSDRLAGLLIEKGVLPDNIVGIKMERTIEMVIGIFGILKSGGAYLPIDPEYPGERIDYMLKDSGARIFVLNFENFNSLIGCPRRGLSNFDIRISNFNSLNLAYIIYTSGSTGKPKGVAVEHSQLVNFIYHMYGRYEREVGVHDRCLGITNFIFDVSVWEFFLPLSFGAGLVLLPGQKIFDVFELGRAIREEAITLIYLPPALLKPVHEQLKKRPGGLRLNKMLVGVEPIRDEVLENYMRLNPGMKIINGYGPTETTICATSYNYFSHEPVGEIVPIGVPLSNTQVILLDADDCMVPQGIPGEICISGEGVSRGYLNNPELTCEKFRIKNGKGEAILYRTGDLARLLPDGNLLFIGRRDNQLKVRGYRIEPGEIENRLLKHPGIREAVVLSIEDPGGDKHLAAYFVSDRELADTELREHLLNDLPEYMIPTYFTPLEKIPLTSNGKIDRKALPKPGLMKTGENYTAPRNEIEKKLVEVWSEVLGRQVSIGIDDNFFELGGHSLKATILAAKIHKVLNAHVPLAEIFKRSTIRGLAEYISGKVEEPYESIRPVEKKEYYELSSTQKRLYFLRQLESDTVAYNIQVMIPLSEDVRIGKLEEVFKKLIKRHESLRTSFHMVNDAPVQVVHDEAVFEIKSLTTGANFFGPFDLSRAPLIRAGLIREEGKRHILIVDMHHIITDGVSQKLLKQDFMSLYKGEELPSLRLQYKDFAGWQNCNKEREEFKRQELYWLKEFVGEIPVLNIPTDYPRPLMQSFEGNRVDFEIAAEETRALNELALKAGATLFMVLAAVLNILLSRLSGREDIIIGAPVAGRRHADLEKIIGMFVNSLAIRNYPAGEKSFTGFLKELKERTLAAFENQEYQFEDLVEKVVINRDTGRNPLFDVLFVVQDIERLPGDVVEKGAVENGKINRVSKFDLEITALEVGQGLKILFGYCTKLFKKETIERFIIYLKKILLAVVKEPGIRLSEIEIISEEEKTRILFDFNNTGKDYPKDKTIHQLFEEQVERTPDHIVFVGAVPVPPVPLVEPVGPVRPLYLTYRQLNGQSGRLAGFLIEKGVQPDTIVGIMMERSVEMAVGIMGILKSGGAYLPIDPEYPRERIDYMLKDSGAAFVLNFENLNFNSLIGRPSRGLSNLSSANLAYIIYTSGTTGRPKGVMIDHGSIFNTIYWRMQEYKMKAGDRSLQLFSFAFDGFLTSFFTPVVSGAMVVQLRNEEVKDVAHIKETILTMGITHFICVPSLYRFLVEISAAKEWPGLKTVILAGEQVHPDIIEKSKRMHPLLEICNEYGPTEGSVVASFYRDTRPDDVISIGRPISNAGIYILDRNENLVPIGVPGELVIFGKGLARGYLNNPGLTSEKFGPQITLITQINLRAAGGILYRTGDLACWLPDGNIEFLGRIDNQVKIRGFRIEIGEIESQLQAYPGIKDAVVAAKEGGDGQYLCAYVTAKNGDKKEPDILSRALREHLSNRLPHYMVPGDFVLLEEIPLTASGKVDRKALSILKASHPGTGSTFVAPGTDMEKLVAGVWKEILQVDTIGIHANFFEIGGNSLNILKMQRKLKEILGQDIPVIKLFKYPTIHSLAKYYLEPGGNDISIKNDRSEALVRGERDRNIRLQMRKKAGIKNEKGDEHDDDDE
ncbi:MAG TPA: amino acid adenylation domain-containing protein [Candidatus Deferrimicrobium sp.]|nr:amino acid adenylation domain-containing protein [Candidatus Deferrimicrobium sp.]